MYHSLIFKSSRGTDARNTWNHWHLIPSARPVVSQPTVSYKYVDVPGRDGSLDFSNYLLGRPAYSDRSGSFSFYVANEDPVTGENYGNWVSRKEEIAQYLNGRDVLRMSLEDDPNYYYLGRFYLKDWQPGSNFSTVTIEYRVQPYKYSESTNKAVIG